ncbi:uncharacterized protein LOC131842961 isoform X1 [Achroia grisella]|uniref:uncharacterized protein LOC131842961 isoform X1 n=1 Tax=Achroia grisella TaxID=688607 RepID=UPI0027D29540|nr:uncharacterized protein LOC131842961 isoform X1 [Achroia grisella]
MVDKYEKTRGASITPSARRSIHNHLNCPFLFNDTMGRYGLNKTSAGATCISLHNDQEFDEVDNVMSKPVGSSSPLQIPANYRNANRRQSLNISSYEAAEDKRSDSDSEFYYPENNDYIGLSSHEPSNGNVNESYSPVRESSICNEYQSFGSQSIHRSASSQENSRNYETRKIYIFLMPLVAFMIYIVVYWNGISNLLQSVQGTSSIIYDELNFHTDINNLRRRYKITDDTVLQLQTGISTIYRRQDTGSFIFIYNSNSNNFNSVVFNRFMNDVSSTSAQYLRNNTKLVQHVVVQSTSLDMHTHNELIKKYKDDVDKSGLLLITEIDKVPSSLAMAFHYYCDEYNPLVKKSAIFFTLNLAQCSNVSSDQVSKHAIIEKCLEDKWYGGVSMVNMAPLLTRVVNIVVDVTSIGSNNEL